MALAHPLPDLLFGLCEYVMATVSVLTTVPTASNPATGNRGCMRRNSDTTPSDLSLRPTSSIAAATSSRSLCASTSTPGYPYGEMGVAAPVAAVSDDDGDEHSPRSTILKLQDSGRLSPLMGCGDRHVRGRIRTSRGTSTRSAAHSGASMVRCSRALNAQEPRSEPAAFAGVRAGGSGVQASACRLIPATTASAT